MNTERFENKKSSDLQEKKKQLYCWSQSEVITGEPRRGQVNEKKDDEEEKRNTDNKPIFWSLRSFVRSIPSSFFLSFSLFLCIDQPTNQHTQFSRAFLYVALRRTTATVVTRRQNGHDRWWIKTTREKEKEKRTSKSIGTYSRPRERKKKNCIFFSPLSSFISSSFCCFSLLHYCWTMINERTVIFPYVNTHAKVTDRSVDLSNRNRMRLDKHGEEKKKKKKIFDRFSHSRLFSFPERRIGCIFQPFSHVDSVAQR